MFQSVITLFASLLGFHAKAQCPDASLKETALDCPWALVTRSLDGENDFGKIRTTIDQNLPGFMVRFEQDSKSKDLQDLWGLSRNIDESNLATGLKTVPQNLLQYFVSIWGVPYNSDFTIGHAGLNHTYGYLFSTQLTPYGYKRARYVQGELEAGFGLTDGLLSGTPVRGTLFSNMTYFAGSIAFRDNPVHIASDVLELTEYPYESLSVKRLLEVVSNDQFTLEIRTDIVEFPKTNLRGQDTAMLIYSIDYHKKGEASRPRLITAFPVQPSFAKGVFDPTLLGDSLPIKLKYNASLPDTISGELMVGKRTIFNESDIIRNHRTKR